MAVFGILDLNVSPAAVWLGEAEDTTDAFKRFSEGVNPRFGEVLGPTFDFVELWPDRPWHLLVVGNGKRGSDAMEGDAIPESWIMRTLAYGEAAKPSLAELTPELQIQFLRHKLGASPIPLTEDDPEVLHASFRAAPDRPRREALSEHL